MAMHTLNASSERFVSCLGSTTILEWPVGINVAAPQFSLPLVFVLVFTDNYTRQC